MPLQSRSTRVKNPCHFRSWQCSCWSSFKQWKSHLNSLGNVCVNGPLEGSSVNYENDCYEILKFKNKLKFTFTDVDNKSNKVLVQKCNSTEAATRGAL